MHMDENGGRTCEEQVIDGLCVIKLNVWKIVIHECVEEKVEECLTILWKLDCKYVDGEVPGGWCV